MGTLLLLIIFGGAIYVLWFMKFTLPDGTVVKGWLNKFLEEKKGTTIGAPNQAQAPTQAQPVNQPTNQPDDQPVNKPLLEATPLSNGDEEFCLGDQSKMADFETALEIAVGNNAFSEESSEAMMEYVAWMLIAGGRTDDPALNVDTIWDHLANAWQQNKEGYEQYYKDEVAKGEAEEWMIEKLPAWFVNNNFLNAISRFVQYAPGHFEQATVFRINVMSNDLFDARQGHTQIKQEPCAGDYLAQIYTFLHLGADSMIDVNTKMLKAKYPVFFDLPEF